MADYSSWKVADLKTELKNRGIPQTGLRLKQHFIDKLAEEDAKAQSGEIAAPEPEPDAQQESAPEPASSAPEPQPEAQSEQPQPEQSQTDEPRQPEAPVAQEQLQVEPIPERPQDGDAQPGVEPDQGKAQAPAGQDTQPTGDVEMPQAAAEEITQTKAEPSEQAPEITDEASRPVETLVPQTSEANTELSTPLPVEEALEDKRKRKRRSQSPVPTAEVIANKKARAKEESLRVALQDDQDSTLQDESVRDPTPHDRPVPKTSEDGPLAPAKQDARFRGLFASTEAVPAQASSEGQDVAMEDANVEPALHPATSSLYIDGLMRPMQPTLLRNHLISLVAAPGSASSPEVISEFYLDAIKTHCFVRFADTLAASRVRSAIHGTVWPDERNRKKLRADFIPDEQIKEFIQTEEASRDRPGRPVRWEVRYDTTNDGLSAVLVESGSHPLAAPERARESEFNRTPPSGPRGSAAQAERRPSHAPPAPPSRPGQGFKPLDVLFESTTAKPKLYYLPVPRKVADKRLDQFDELLRKGTFDRRGGDEMRRITFEDDDYFVDGGPEYGARTLQRRQGRGGRPGDSRRGR